MYRVRRALAATTVVLVVVGAIELVRPDRKQIAVSTVSSTTTTTIPHLPDCRDGDVPVSGSPLVDWATLLVDAERALPATFAPRDLRSVTEAGFAGPPGVAVRRLVLEDLAALREAAAVNGTPIGVLDAYRSFQAQTELFEGRSSIGGGYETGSRILRPGHSEHQLGTVVDVAGDGLAQVDATWGSSAAGQWIAGNAYDFGFIVSYPRDATEQTCFEAEPWHLRYVGRERAQAIIDSGLTAREHFWRLSQGIDPNAP